MYASRFFGRLSASSLAWFTGVMRVIVIARQTLTSEYENILHRLVNILGLISTNPSNPNFDQFTFESISALIRSDYVRANALPAHRFYRFIVKASPSTLSTFEQILFGPISIILQQDIDRKHPLSGVL